MGKLSTARVLIALPQPAQMAEATGATSPVSWWLIGLVALLALAVVLFALQYLGGNTGTDVIPGTPIAASQSAG